jgi:hypothetical protein
MVEGTHGLTDHQEVLLRDCRRTTAPARCRSASPAGRLAWRPLAAPARLGLHTLSLDGSLAGLSRSTLSLSRLNLSPLLPELTLRRRRLSLHCSDPNHRSSAQRKCGAESHTN